MRGDDRYEADGKTGLSQTRNTTCPALSVSYQEVRPCLHKQSEEIWDGGTQDGFEHHGSDICQCVLPLQLGLLSDGGVGLELVWQFNARKGSIIM